MKRTPLIAAASLGVAAFAGAQEPKFALAPASTPVTMVRDVEYGRSDSVVLRLDVVRPANSGGRVLPTLVFFNRATGADRSNGFYGDWARAAASRGVIGVLPDLRDGEQPADFAKLMAFLVARGRSLGIDPDAIAVYAASGNVFTAFPLLEDPQATAVKAAVIYYGTGPVSQFRLDLPVLYVRAGLDRPTVNADITALAGRAIAQNAPVTLRNHPTGYHGFEIFNDDDATRAVIEETIAFVKEATSPRAQTALRAGLLEASAAGFVQTAEFGKAAGIYAQLVARRPNEHRLRLSYGEALLGDGQYGAACDELEKLRGKPLGPRDLGLPAARACAQAGRAEVAIGWLRSIPTRFLPPSVQEEAVFASLRGREDFRALFPPR